MKKRLMTLALALLAAVAVLALCPETAYAIDDTDTVQLSLRGNKNYDAAFDVLYLVNQERQANGLGTLVMDQSLLDTAMQRAAELGIDFAHERPNGTRWSTAIPSYYASYAGENIASGYNSARSVMDGWMNSEGHRNNILNANYTCMGVGCFYQPRNGSIYWVQVFSGKTARTVVTSSRGVVYELAWVEAQHQKLDLGFSRNLTYLTAGDSTTVSLQQNGGVVLDSSCLSWKLSGNELEIVNDGEGTVNAVRCGEGTLSMTLRYASGETETYTTDYRVKPSVPVVTGSINADGKPTLSWPEIPGVTGYQVMRSGSDGFVEYITDNSWTDTSAVPGKRYSYRVRAYKQREYGAHLESQFSPAVTLLCQLKTPTVSAGNVSSSGNIRLSWKAVDGAVEYEVYRSGYRNGTYTKMFTTANTSYTNTGITPGYTYYYKVRAVAADGTVSEFSSVVNRTADCAAPKVSSSGVSSGGIKLSWNAVKGASKYYVYRSTDGGKTYAYYGTTSNTTYTNKSVTPGQTYYYKVKAVCGRTEYGNSALSNASYRTADCAAPVVSIRLSSSGKPQLKWAAVEGASKYYVYRSTDGKNFSHYDSTTKTTYTNTGAKSGTTYYYKIVAVCKLSSYGNSAYSNVVSVRSK